MSDLFDREQQIFNAAIRHVEEIHNGDLLNPESKGAGLGLIEIARRASSPIEYKFTPFDDGLTFFTMFVTIGSKKEG